MNDVLTVFDRMVEFPRVLRGLGLPVPTDRSIAFCRAACLLDPMDLGSLYWAGRITLTSDPSHIPTYDYAFDNYFFKSSGSERDESLPSLAAGKEEGDQQSGHSNSHLQMRSMIASPPPTDDSIGAAASEVQVLKYKSFDALTEEEYESVARSIRKMKVIQPLRRSRRLRPHRAGDRLDGRRTLRRALRTGGEPVSRVWLRKRLRKRPLVMMLDVSGSMTPYSRALLQFGYAAIRSGGRVEVFTFGTQLTRVTRLLHHPDPDVSLARLSAKANDWDGGTRIGDSARQLVAQYSQSTTLRGAIVIVCSDGLDRGDPQLLQKQMARLSRLSHRLLWVNPLRGDPRYQPLAGGMRAALPYVDDFVSGHNLASLGELTSIIETSAD